MKAHRISMRKILRTLSRLSYMAGVALLIASLALNFMPVQQASAAVTSIWTTRTTCTTPDPQDENHYVTGDTVYIRGNTTDPLTQFAWTITGNPGGSSGDPETVVASSSMPPGTIITTNASGYFCFAAYTIPPGDWGTYTVDVYQVSKPSNSKNDNYRVDEILPTATNTPTDTPTSTPTDTPTSTPTDTPTSTPTDTPTSTPTDTPTSTPTDLPTATNTPTDLPTATNTPTDLPTATNTPTDLPTATNTPTDLPTATNTPTDLPTATNTPTDLPPTDEPTPTPTTILVTDVPTDTPTEDPGQTPTVPPTLPPPPDPTNPPQVLIPVTGADLSMPAPLNGLQSTFGNLGLALLGVGLVLQGLSRKMED